MCVYVYYKQYYSTIINLHVIFSEADGQPCMVFELMAFGDLAHVLRKSSIDLKEPIQGLQPLDQVKYLSIYLIQLIHIINKNILIIVF